MNPRIENRSSPRENRNMSSVADKIIRVGCQSWGYDDWVSPVGGDPIFYPTGTKKNEMLTFYSSVFDTIEIDATLYGIPAATTFEKWYGETPDDFIFSLKSPREITHDGKLSPSTVPIMHEFVERSELLKEKLGIFLIQLPPSFDGSRKNGQNVRSFLEALPTGFRYAIEFRHSDWFIDWTFDELERYGVALGLVEGPWIARDLMFDAATLMNEKFAYIRIMGERDLDKFDRVQRDRSDILEQWAIAIGALTAEQVFVYIDNYFEGFAPATAAKLQTKLGLPVRRAADFQEQGSLF